MTRMAAPICLVDYEQLAMLKLDKNARDYYKSGADEEETLRWNTTDFKKFVET